MKTRRKPEKKIRPARNVLMIIALLLLGSALVRAGVGAGQALANSYAATTPSQSELEECDTPADFEALLSALKSREQLVQSREKQIRARVQALAVADREIEEKLARLSEAEEWLRATLALADTAAEDDIARLVAVYEAMKPKDAAILFEEMAPDFAAGFLGRMRPEAAAGVLAGLSPQAAYSLSVILAGRNASVPQD